ncbi:hypothetical protein SDRG_15311 [Saprolegnia diclina VS20]|uniref:Expansin-like EG45 domain-containing protein n=1 Tax=Saprolegnia diclina (strain VS20) TaxID=1156394 RepID=T0R4B0_SAPDV|nr:hypothetical protein SDRG_15311 [Saprolegnia diclina VS20]EQC26888.1 hypothetical protein SDRG_15311 [Saprolegnia diclina VS20]|eukprot:XP_008619701.1 hypothetical protein SDRG_15311 [Saprolegnia diclina VS20]
MAPTSLLFLVAAAFAATATAFSGPATTYGGPDGVDVQGGNCGIMASLPNAKAFHVAINHEQWDSGRNCGRCVQVTCTDKRCKSHAKVIGQVTDQCHECGYGGLDLTLPFFKQVTGDTTDRYTISWSFVNCPVSGNIQVCAKEGSNQYWLAVQAGNTRSGVASMSINGKKSPLMNADSNYFYVSTTSNIPLSKTQVSLTSFSGQVVSATVNLTPGKCTAIRSQFTL